MKIFNGSDPSIVKILKQQNISERTQSGRPLVPRAIDITDSIIANLDDYKNSDAVSCKGCNFVTSIDVTETGCPNCDCLDIEVKMR